MTRYWSSALAALVMFSMPALAQEEGAPAEAQPADEAPTPDQGTPDEAPTPDEEPAAEEPADEEPAAEEPAADEPADEELMPQAEEEKKPSLLWAQATSGGLTGYGEIITTHIPGAGEQGIRIGVRAETQKVSIDEKIGLGTARIRLSGQVYQVQAAIGVMDMIEVSLGVPVVDYELTTNISIRDQDVGFGNPELGVKFKLPIKLDLISAAAYTRIRFGWGDPDVFEPKRFPVPEGHKSNEWELGSAIGIHMGDAATGYMNLAFRMLEGGTWSFRYRFGVAVHPIDMLQLGVYYDGVEFGGAAGSNGTLGFSAAIRAEPVYFMVNFDWLIEDNAIDRTLTIGAGDDVEAWSFGLAVGATF